MGLAYDTHRGQGKLQAVTTWKS